MKVVNAERAARGEQAALSAVRTNVVLVAAVGVVDLAAWVGVVELVEVVVEKSGCGDGVCLLGDGYGVL